MSETHSDLNLLFGVIALQMDFVTRDQLVDGLNRWAVNKRRTLGELLVEIGSLTEETRSLLAKLVDKHIDVHGRVEDSLVACSQASPAWDRILETIEDRQLESSIQILTVTRDGSDTVPAAGAVGASRPENRFAENRFEILRPHARGGLGEVFVARDTELNRDVAVKAIKSRLAHDTPSRTRFLMEAEITGRLEHPGVVPVYGLGQQHDGRPYYAMRFIKGQDMKSALQKYHTADSPHSSGTAPVEAAGPASRLELRKLLARFIDVCETMEYAHSRGIVHRDLKPSNIMLGDYGETLVVDWGLAKPVAMVEDSSCATAIQPGAASSGSLSVAGAVLGTPMYMSPEQAAGQIDELGPTSDVYSLGATLYNLLTGRAPFERGDDTGHDSVLDRVRRGEFSSPRSIDRHVPAALDAICMRAMALKPAHRYASARDLAADVERWLADEPVTAFTEPVAVRARRWVARHRTAVFSLAAAAVVAIVSLGAFGGIVAAKNNELESSNLRLVSANERERESAQRAAASAREAREQSQLLEASNLRLVSANERERESAQHAAASARVAREQSQLALGTLDSVIFNIQERLKNVPGGLALRAELLRTALQGLAAVESSLVTQYEVDLPTAKAYSELGRVFMRVGNDKGLGGLDSAQRMFDAQFDTARQLLAKEPDNLAVQVMWAEANENRASYLDTTGKVDQAQPFIIEAHRLRERHARDHPDTPGALWELSRSWHAMAEMNEQLGHDTEALEQFGRAADVARALLDAQPDNRGFVTGWFRSVRGQARILTQRGGAPDVVRALEQIREVAQQQMERLPNDPYVWHDLADVQQDLGDVYLRLRRVSDAHQAMLADLELARRLYNLEPYDLHHRRHLALTHTGLGRVCLMQGEATAGLDHLKNALDLYEEHLRITPRDAMGLYDLSIALERLADVCLQLKQLDDAGHYADRQVATLEKLVAAEPANARYRRALALGHNRVGNVHQTREDRATAREHYELGLAVLQTLAENDSDDVQIQRDLTFSYNKIGDTYYFESEFAKAVDLYAQSLEIRRTLVTRFPNDKQLEQDLGVSLERIGNIHFQQGRSDEALDYFNQSLDVRRRQMLREPDDAVARRNVGTILGNMGVLEQNRARYPEAIAHYDEAIKLLTELQEQGKLAPRYQQVLSGLTANRKSVGK